MVLRDITRTVHVKCYRPNGRIDIGGHAAAATAKLGKVESPLLGKGAPPANIKKIARPNLDKSDEDVIICGRCERMISTMTASDVW